MRIPAPVIKLAASLAKKTARPPISSNSPQRPIGIGFTKVWNFSGSFNKGVFISVPNGPGRMAFTVMPRGAHSSARVTLEGHADERGTREYNLGLGERRVAL